MKRTITLFAMIMFSIIVFGQKSELLLKQTMKHGVNSVSKVSGTLAATDTVYMNDFLGLGTTTLITNYGGGYFFGTNTLACNSIAQGYKLQANTHYGISEVLIMVGAIYKSSASGTNMTCTIRNVNGTSSYSYGGTNYNIICPNTIKGSTVIPWSAIDTSGGWTIATFATPVYVDTNYAVAIDFSGLYANSDTIGFVSSKAGGASATMGKEYTWWKYGTKWCQPNHIYTVIDNSLAFFPVVDSNYVDVISEFFVNGSKLNQSIPNPADGMTSIPYSIEKNSKVMLTVYDVKGNIVMTFDEGTKQNGTYAITFDASSLASGSYYYSLTSDNNRLTKKMIVKH